MYHFLKISSLPTKTIFVPAPKAAPPQNTWMHTAWLQLEDESTRERWTEERSASLSSLTISNYLMSHSHFWKHWTSRQWTQTTNMAVVSTHSITFRPFSSLSSSRQCWKIHTDVDSGLTFCFIQPLFGHSLFFFCLSFLSLPFLCD